MRRRVCALVGTVAILALPHAALADGLLNTIRNDVQAQTAGWLGRAMAIANDTFLALAFLWFVYTLCKSWMASLAGESSIGLVIWPWGQAIYNLIVPWVIVQVVAGGFLADLIGNAGTLAGMITGEHAVLTPDGVFNVGATKAGKIIVASLGPIKDGLHAGPLGLAPDLGAVATSILMFMVALTVAVALILMFTLLACELLSLTIRVYVCISIAAVNLGFFGSPATAHIAQRYVNAVWGAILRLVTLTAWIYLAAGVVDGWAILEENADIEHFMLTAFHLLGGSVAILFLTLEVGGMCDTVVSGSGGGSILGRVASVASRTGGAALRAARRDAA